MIQPSPSLVSQGFSSRVVMPTNAKVGQPLVIAEAPGAREDETGITLHPEAEAGGLFTRLLARVGVSRDNLTLSNTIWQRPPGNELYDKNGYPLAYTRSAIEYWKPTLYEFIEEMQPPVIIGLGRTALETLTGFTDIGTTRGYVTEARIDIERMEGDPLADDWNHMWDRKSLHIPTVCTYHPAFLNYGQRHLSGVFIRDVLAALEIAESGWEETVLHITPAPSPDDFRWFCRQYNPDIHKLTVDIENPESRAASEDELLEGKKEISYEIDRLSFCYADDIGGWSVPFVEPYLSMAKELMASNGPKRGHNCRLHDFPRLQSHGFVINGREYDTLDMWKHLHRTLPASLAYIVPFYTSCRPWKHEAHSQPEAYSALDAIHQHRIAEGMERDLRASNQWEVYERHVVEIISTNHGVCTQMAKNGLPIDPVKIEAFKIELVQKRLKRSIRLAELVPDSIKTLDPRTGYKTLPKKIKAKLAANDLRGCVLKKAKDGKKEHWYTLVQLPMQVAAKKLTNAEKTPFVDGGLWDRESDVYVMRWTKKFDFNPASPPQVAKLLGHFGHKAKTNRKTKEDTTGDDTLKSLITKYTEAKKESDLIAVECYKLIRECRAIDKVLGTYVKGWKPAGDGLIHATPGIWGDMYRISWRKPNLAATVADKKEIQIAAGFRKCICVGDQDVIIESDWKGMEALLVGYFAGDQDYMRLARLGVHDFMGHHMMKLPISMAMSDDELNDRFKWFKAKYPKQRDDAKHTIHGVGYGMTAFLMAELYEMTRTRAQQLIDLLFDLFPKVKLWQQATMQKAHDECKLTNAWGYRMPFWNVFAWQQKRYDRLRMLWVRFKTDARAMFAKRDREAVDAIAGKVALGVEADAAIASLCYDLGDEAKSALAFLPRDTGAAMLKDTLLALRDEYGLDKRVLRANAHDSILAICPRKQADEVAWQLKSTMERPQERLSGLIIGAEVSLGMSWDKASMKEWGAHALSA